MVLRQGRKQLDDPDLIFIVRLLPLGIEDVYAFREDALHHAKDLRAAGKRVYVVSRKPKLSYEESL